MTDQEAIKVLRELRDKPKYAEASGLAIEALRRYIPKAPLRKSAHQVGLTCPMCQHPIGRVYFCPHCGQAIEEE